jgi:hypothetical protein
MRSHPYRHVPDFHDGIDISTNGTTAKLKIVAGGNIAWIRQQRVPNATTPTGYGNYTNIEYWMYAHLCYSDDVFWKYEQDDNLVWYFAINPGGGNWTYYSTVPSITKNLAIAVSENPAIASGILATPGPGPQATALLRLLTADGAVLHEWEAFPGSKYGCSAAMGDVTGDGVDEIIAAKGPDPKNNAALRVFNREGVMLSEFMIGNSKYGLQVAAGDVDGDWRDEIIVGLGSDPKNPSLVRIFEYESGALIETASLTAYGDLKYGVRVAVGDVNGDGSAEIATAPGPGPGNPALVKLWKIEGGSFILLNMFTAFERMYGATIALGDLDGDQRADIITGTGPSPNVEAWVRIFRSDGTKVTEFQPYTAAHTYGTNVTAADLDADGFCEIITGIGPGPQNASIVKIFRPDGTEMNQFTALPDGFKYGVNVAAGGVGR